jgi:hypothetical protein
MKKKVLKKVKKPSKTLNPLDKLAVLTVQTFLRQAELLLWRGEAQSCLSPPFLKMKTPSKIGYNSMALRLLTHLFGAILLKEKEICETYFPRGKEKTQWVFSFRNNKWKVQIQNVRTGKVLSLPLVIPRLPLVIPTT